METQRDALYSVQPWDGDGWIPYTPFPPTQPSLIISLRMPRRRERACFAFFPSFSRPLSLYHRTDYVFLFLVPRHAVVPGNLTRFPVSHFPLPPLPEGLLFILAVVPHRWPGTGPDLRLLVFPTVRSSKLAFLYVLSMVFFIIPFYVDERNG